MVRQDVSAVAMSEPQTASRSTGVRSLHVAAVVLSALLALPATAAWGGDAGQPQNHLTVADGCCVCRVKTDGAYATSSCTDLQGIDTCYATCQTQDSDAMAFSAGASCQSGCRGMANQ
jgi:hypothetical protein